MTRSVPYAWSRRVSIVDPDAGAVDQLASLLRGADADVCAYRSAEAFLAEMPALRPACVITEVALPVMSGLVLLHRLRALEVPPATIVIASDPAVAVAVQAIRAGAIAFFEKPCCDSRIVQRVRAVLAAAAA
jgi:two-component system, LuxR family, response regulator FixJ